MLPGCKHHDRDIRPEIEARYARPSVTYIPGPPDETGRENFERMLAMRKPGICLDKRPYDQAYISGYVDANWWAFRAGALWAKRGGETVE